MRSSVDRPDPGAVGEHLFSRDCAQYQCRLLSGATVWVLVNHFKSQSGGGGPKRARQAQGVRTIAEDLVAAGERHIVVMGDLNEGPTVLGQPAANLATLLDPNGPLVEVYALPTFDPGRGLGPSRAVGSATASTTSWSPTTWPGWCRRHRTTRTVGHADQRQPAGRLGHLAPDHRRPSGSLRPRRHLRRYQHLTDPAGQHATQLHPSPRIHGHDPLFVTVDPRRVGGIGDKARGTTGGKSA
jgi:endonuclease/exonuclease/phosphatase family protein